MTFWLVLGALLLLGSILLAKFFLSADPRVLAQFVRYAVGSLLILLSLAVFSRGDIGLGLFCLSLGVMVIGNWLPPGLNPFGSSSILGRAGKSSGQESSISTATLRMTLNHNTGQMDGEVLAGPFASQVLSAMSIEELFRLLDMCRQNDPDAARLLEAYLQRHRSDELDANWEPDAEGNPGQGNLASGRMGRDEAFAVLGLGPGASKEEILSAHRQLMKKFHPDQGGSNYLASKINEAKDLLIGE